MSERIKKLKENAEKAGFDKTEDYVLHCEMNDVIRKVKSSLDRAFILEDVRLVPVLCPTENKKKK